MKKRLILFLIVLIFLISFVFSFELIRFYSNSVDSHACDPNDATCAYQNVVEIDDSAKPTGNSGDTILRISSKTNAHVELDDYTNYDNEIKIKDGLISNGTCYFTDKGDNCNNFDNCGFAISDVNNAHLSRCNTFLDEIKFCCNIQIGIKGPPPKTGFCGLNIFEVEVRNEEAFVKFQCPIDDDINLFIFNQMGDSLLSPFNNPSPIEIDCNTKLQEKKLEPVVDFKVREVYNLRAQNDDCLKELYFTIEDTAQEINISDNNLFLLIGILFSVLFITKGFNTRKE